MNTKTVFLAFAMTAANWAAAQIAPPKPVSPNPPPPPPISTVQSSAPSAEKFIYDHKATSERPYLVAPEQAQTIISRFKEAYAKMGNPRTLLYVNRELVNEEAGLKLSARSQQTEAARGTIPTGPAANPGNAAKSANAGRSVASGDPKASSVESVSRTGNSSGHSEKVTSKNTYRVRERKAAPLADKQTVRDVERLIGRPLRMAGVTLVDQHVATQLMADQPLAHFTVPTEGEAARKDREALAKLADVVLEILISSRQVTVTGAAGDSVVAVPDIQVTAIRLKDSKIVGQASAGDLIGHSPAASKVARNFGVREISEATALALMEDMTQWP